jgi:hypothetical protein
MAKTFVYRDGARLTPIMLYWINRLDADFFKRWGVHIIVSSGIRLRSEQAAIWYARYVTAGNVRGRRVYDTRWWKGQLWYRISSAGTVLPPDSPLANHVLENTDSGAVDLRDTGKDAGILTAGSERDRWLHEIVNGKPRIEHYNLSNEGDGFGERWHKKYLGNPWAAVPKPKPKPTPTKKDTDMTHVGSKKTKNQYAIFQSASSSATEPLEKTIYDAAYGDAVMMESSSVQFLLNQSKERADQANTKLIKAIDKMIADEA